MVTQINGAEPELTSQQRNRPPNLISSVAQVFKHSGFPPSLSQQPAWVQDTKQTQTQQGVRRERRRVRGGRVPEVRRWKPKTQSRTWGTTQDSSHPFNLIKYQIKAPFHFLIRWEDFTTSSFPSQHGTFSPSPRKSGALLYAGKQHETEGFSDIFPFFFSCPT